MSGSGSVDPTLPPTVPYIVTVSCFWFRVYYFKPTETCRVPIILLLSLSLYIYIYIHTYIHNQNLHNSGAGLHGSSLDPPKPRFWWCRTPALRNPRHRFRGWVLGFWGSGSKVAVLSERR